MEEVRYYRNASGNFWELKTCQNASHAEKPHYHDEWAVGSVEEGRCLLTLAGVQIAISAPAAVVFKPGTVHSCFPDLESPWKFRMLFWKGTPDVPWPDDLFVCPENNATLQTLSHFFTYLENETPVFDRFPRELNAILELLQQSSGTFRWSSQGKDSQLAGRLSQNFLQSLSFDQLANEQGLNKSVMIRRFKKNQGVPPALFRQIGRINLAKDYLRKGLNLGETALRSGFYDQSHFTKIFRRFTGVSPGNYRNPPGAMVNIVQDRASISR